MSIRLRLTLWQTALLALVLAAFAVVVYAVVARQETSRLDSTLSLNAEDVRLAYLDARRAVEGAEGGHRGGPGGYSAEPDRGDAGRPRGRGDDLLPLPEVDAAITGALGDERLVARILGPGGEELARSDNADQLAGLLSIPPGLLRRVIADGKVRETLTIGGNPVRLYGDEIPTGPGQPNALLVATSLRPLQASLDRWRLILAATVLGATALSAAIGWFVASQAMRPVDRMTRAAHAIGHSADLSRRLPEPARRDELGRLAATFNEMLGQLGEAFANQKRFLADASHELRTPLTTVRTNVEALLRGAGADPAERDETLRAIARESDRMARLVNDLLALARVDAGQPLERRRFPLDTLALEVYHQERALADGVRLELGDWEQVEIEGDPDRLKQVLLNLVDNALRHTPTGGTVTLDLRRRGDEAVLRVRDTGPGIAAEHLDRIFDRFFRVDQPRSRRAGGTGLGLAIAREVTAAHGGRIDVESRVGAGSAFSLVLPATAPELPVAPATARLPTTTRTLTSP